jgi:hypothetical protein
LCHGIEGPRTHARAMKTAAAAKLPMLGFADDVF